jgi:hypothetical protein
MKAPPPDFLYDLLPRIYRRRDVERQRPLRALIGVLQEDFARLHCDITRQYDDWFIDRCGEDVVPEIGALVGVRLPEEPDLRLPRWRSLVANALGYRRRKGIPAALERVIDDACGWSAQVIDMYEHVAATQSVRQERPGRGALVDVRRAETVPTAAGAESAARTVDVHAGDGERPGLYNLRTVGVLVHRSSAYPIERSEPYCVREGCYTFHPLGLDVPLYNLPGTVEDVLEPRRMVDLPMAVPPAAFAEDLASCAEAFRSDDEAAPPAGGDWFGEQRSIRVLIDGETISPVDAQALDLGDWTLPGPTLVGVRSAPFDAARRPTVARPSIGFQLRDERPRLVTLGERVARLADLVPLLERGLRAAGRDPALAGLRVIADGDTLLVIPGAAVPGEQLRFSATQEDRHTAYDLGLAHGLLRRVSLLRSETRDDRTPSLRGTVGLRLGAATIDVQLGAEGDGAAPLEQQLGDRFAAAGLPWRALRDGDALVIAAEAPDETMHLRAEPTGDDPRTARLLGLTPRVGVDVARGRLAFALGCAPASALRASWAFGRALDLGAGPYPRPLARPALADRPWYGTVSKLTQPSAGARLFPSLVDAVVAWRASGRDGVIRVLDSSTYDGGGDASLRIELGAATLAIEVEDGAHPTLAAPLAVRGADGACLGVDGLELGGGITLDGSLRLDLSHVTVHGTIDNAAAGPDERQDVRVRASMVGPLRLTRAALLTIDDTIVDGRGGPAIAAPSAGDQPPTFGPDVLSLVDSTLLGPVLVDHIEHGEGALFSDTVAVRRAHESVMRCCALPWGSHEVAQRARTVVYHAPPDADVAGAIPDGPLFISVTPGQPGYARLSDDAPQAIREGASDGSEIGAFRDMQAARRRAQLEAAIDDHLPAGLTAAIQLTD